MSVLDARRFECRTEEEDLLLYFCDHKLYRELCALLGKLVISFQNVVMTGWAQVSQCWTKTYLRFGLDLECRYMTLVGHWILVDTMWVGWTASLMTFSSIKYSQTMLRLLICECISC
jgi:hypothetical protein